jgi:hypothetical protein
MKKIQLFKMVVLFIFAGLFFIAGCGSSSDNSSANVVVHLTTDGTTPYLVDQMTGRKHGEDFKKETVHHL